ncbi:MAG: BTAD domain-containing putative transcriptional regulator, partial [Gemmatimonadales bacterium]
MIECRLLGPVELTIDGRPPQPDLLWRKNLALLVYLARSPKRRRTRQHLMGLLWPEKSETSARQSLREAIRILRKALGKNGLSTEHDQVQLVEGAVHLDTEDFEALEQAADWPAIAAAVQGEFLEGFGVPDASAFEDWLAAERDTWRRRALDALVAGAGSALARGQAGTAADWARRALHLDPGSDAAARMAMTALAVEGDRAAALECYERLAGRLAEVGAEPEAETRVLAERVKAERTWRLSGEVPTEPERGAESRRAPLVGRDREIQALLETGCATEADRGPLVCIILGDSGLGKSRLLDEVLSRARLGGAAVAAVRAVEGDLETPWSGMVGLARGGLVDAAGIAGASPAALASLAAAA